MAMMDPVMALEEAAVSHQKALDDAIEQGDSDVQKFYENSVIFLTGGSGFLGKQLIEKLLRSCKISKVYMLLRQKKGKGIQERLDELTDDSVFDRLRNRQTDFRQKIIAVEGDIEQLKLGINDEDYDIFIKEVNVIYHMAAFTRFTEPLQSATMINLRGAREVLSLAKSCTKLRSCVYVSTAYCHATDDRIGKIIEEKFYQTPVSPETMISLAEEMDSRKLMSITPHLIKGWPKTYSFTKALTEELIRTSTDGLPICIVRPAMVTNSYHEPSPGWITRSGLRGVCGWILGVTVGNLHTLRVKSDIKPTLAPCDFVNNAIIVAAKETANNSKGGDDTKIYTIGNAFDFFRIIDEVIANGRQLGSPRAVNYVFVVTTSSKILFSILFLFIQLIPAYITDFVNGLTGKRKTYVDLSKRFYTMMNFIAPHFSLNDWKFSDENSKRLYHSLSDVDKKIFNFNVTDINLTEYSRYIHIGMRKHIIKDDLKETVYASRKQTLFKYLLCLIVILCVYFIWKASYQIMFI